MRGAMIVCHRQRTRRVCSLIEKSLNTSSIMGSFKLKRERYTDVTD